MFGVTWLDDVEAARMWNPEGEADRRPLRPCFDRRLKLEFHGSRVTSDAGLLAYRDLDDALNHTLPLPGLPQVVLRQDRHGHAVVEAGLTGLGCGDLPADHGPEGSGQHEAASGFGDYAEIRLALSPSHPRDMGEEERADGRAGRGR